MMPTSALARYLSCPPSLRGSLPNGLNLDTPATAQAFFDDLETRGLALEAYQALVVERQMRLGEPLRACLRRKYIASAAAGQWLGAELVRVSTALTATGITPVLLKGLHLGALLWSDPALRTFGDLDLWVTPAEVPLADRVLRTLGYSGGPGDPAAPLDPTYHELPVYYRTGAALAAVDLHYNLAPAYLDIPDAAGMYARAIPWQAGVRVLSPADLPIYVCSHVARHLFVEVRPGLLFRTGYRYLGELARLLVHLGRQLDIAAFVRSVEQMRHRRAMLMPLRLVEKLYRLDLPDELRMLWRGDLVGEAISRLLLARLDEPMANLETRAFSFWNYALPDYLSRPRLAR